MKITTILSTNTKGQIVLPFRMRKALEIDEHVSLYVTLADKKIVIEPIMDIVTHPIAHPNASRLDVLRSIQGSWGEATASEEEAEKARSDREQAATEERRRAW